MFRNYGGPYYGDFLNPFKHSPKLIKIPPYALKMNLYSLQLSFYDGRKTKKKSSKRQGSSVVHSRSKSCDRRGENIVSTPSKMGGPRTPRSILDNPTSASSIRVQAEISARSSLRATKSESRLNNRNFGTPLSSKVPASSLITDNEGKKNLGKSVVDWIKKK